MRYAGDCGDGRHGARLPELTERRHPLAQEGMGGTELDRRAPERARVKPLIHEGFHIRFPGCLPARGEDQKAAIGGLDVLHHGEAAAIAGVLAGTGIGGS